MDAETFDTNLMTPQDLGSVYTHCIKRANDFRITAIGGETIEATEGYGKLVRALKDTLYIPKNSREPRLSFELTEAVVQEFNLVTIPFLCLSFLVLRRWNLRSVLFFWLLLLQEKILMR